jgi:drug/metabolite transporter (DMT)-like permease
VNDEIRPTYGLILSLITAILWGVLPLFLTICLQVMDSATITVYRFASAALVVAVILLWRRRWPRISQFPKPTLVLALGATVMLVINYTLNVVGLKYLSPGSVQVLMQIAPFALMLGGVWFYREGFVPLQKWGALCLILGLALFFNQRLPQILASETENPIGILYIVIAAVTWSGYALCQKSLMKNMSAMQLTLVLYVLGTLMLLPFTELASLWHMNSVQFGALIFCCLNTLIAYGAFTEALRVWYASRVSAVIALAPLFTFITMAVAEKLYPDDFHQTEIGFWGYMGASIVILGSVMASLARDKAVAK